MKLINIFVLYFAEGMQLLILQFIYCFVSLQVSSVTSFEEDLSVREFRCLVCSSINMFVCADGGVSNI
jgi:hypothetical protein